MLAMCLYFSDSNATEHSSVDDLNMLTPKCPHACYMAIQLIHFDQTLFSVTFEV